MASDIYSMLTGGGYDPYAESMKQEQAFQQRLSSATDPRSFIAAVGSNLGGQLGRGASRLFGGVSPEEEKDKLKKEALAEVQASGVDMTDQVAVLKGIMQALQKRGLTAEAMAVGASIPKPEKEATTTLAKLLKEQKNYKEGTPGFIAYQKAIDKETASAVSKDPSVGTVAELVAQTKFGKPFSGLNPTEREAVYKEVQKKSSLGEGLTALAEAITKESGKQLGKDIAESVSPVVVKGKEKTLTSLYRAKELLKAGIYAGGLATLKAGVTKYTPLGDREKLVNTEKYVTHMSSSVIPLLKEFGGNDSNQELNFLFRMVGGDNTLEPETLMESIDRAIAAEESEVARLQRNMEAISKGKTPDISVTPQKLGDKPPAPIGVGESTTVNGVVIKRVR